MYKTRVVSRREPMPQKTIDWLNSVNDKYVIYDDIDPYHKLYSFRENIYNIYEESADGMGDVWLNLIIGTEKAMLIDTGFGIGDLKGLCKKLIGHKDLIVVNTHQGPDHAMGNCQFDKVYCHEYCYPAIKAKRCSPRMWDYLHKDGKGIWYDFDIHDIIEYKEYELISVKNNHVFNLGLDHEIELIHTPGHAPGGASFLDKKNRILFTGQFHTNYVSILKGNNPYSEEYGTVTAFRNELVKMVARINEYDVVVPAHEVLYLDKTFVKDMLDTCNAVIDDPDCYDFAKFNEKHNIEIRYKAIGTGSIRYIINAI